MRWSEALMATRRTVPAEADTPSARLVLKAGLAARLASGIYSLSPLAMRVVSRIERILREELDAVGGQEVRLPVVNPADLWQATGRYQSIDDTLVRLHDRAGRPMVLAMTHEECATALAREMLVSYRRLPSLIYQIQTKFRDEARPRAGLIRLREFIMKDAYSFHADAEDLDRMYTQMLAVYRRIFARMELPVLVVDSDSGLMGGRVAHEFILPADAGEDHILACGVCGYAANREVARTTLHGTASVAWQWHRTEGGRPVLAALPRGRHASLAKLAAAAGVPVTPWDGHPPWEADAPPPGTPVVVDASLKVSAPPGGLVADVLEVAGQDPCPTCGAPLQAVRAIEVGNIFKLGTHYAERLALSVTGPNGAPLVPVMGCYGIGVTRLVAAIIEAHHDGAGIRWPASVARWPVHLLATHPSAEVVRAADALYAALGRARCLYDDRSASPGVKFKDADLLGLPRRVAVSPKSLAAGGVEVRQRRSGQTEVLPLEAAIAQLS